MDGRMKVSVIIPCHNCGESVGAAVHSVGVQSHPAYEIIVVDDASTDGSVEAVRASSPEIQLLRVNYRNAAATRNEGIRAATGEWVAFLDADSIWFDYHLSQAIDLVRDTTDVAYMCWGHVSDHPSVAPSTNESSPSDRPLTGLRDEMTVQWRLRGGYGFPTVGMLVRRRVLQDIGGFDVSQRRRHDFELFLRVVHGHTWSYHPRRSWWSRPPRPGDISADTAKCKYYALRALTLNEQRYHPTIMRELIERSARSAFTAALRGGNVDQINRTRQLAWPHLARRDKVIFQVLQHLPKSIRDSLTGTVGSSRLRAKNLGVTLA
jgi:glycosyltransferase involved in cell wall biosynthesis